MSFHFSAARIACPPWLVSFVLHHFTFSSLSHQELVATDVTGLPQKKNRWVGFGCWQSMLCFLMLTHIGEKPSQRKPHRYKCCISSNYRANTAFNQNSLGEVTTKEPLFLLTFKKYRTKLKATNLVLLICCQWRGLTSSAQPPGKDWRRRFPPVNWWDTSKQ